MLAWLLKLAQLGLLPGEVQNQTVLLLDDFSSELDEKMAGDCGNPNDAAFSNHFNECIARGSEYTLGRAFSAGVSRETGYNR